MATVSAREANQHFSKLLDVASRGEEVTITRRGKAVARLVPVEVGEDAAAERANARQAALERLQRGYPGKTIEPWTRDELYEERLKHLLKDDR